MTSEELAQLARIYKLKKDLHTHFHDQYLQVRRRAEEEMKRALDASIEASAAADKAQEKLLKAAQEFGS